MTNREKIRRTRIGKQKVIVKIYINDFFVGQSQIKKIPKNNWEIRIMEKFLIHLFTKPHKIKFVICIKSFLKTQIIDSVEVEIPGENAKTITSTSNIFREVSFNSRVPTKKKPRRRKRK